MNQPDLPKPKNMTEWGDLLEKCIANTKTLAPEASSTLLDQVLSVCPDGRGKGLNAAFERKLPDLREMLPDQFKKEAERFIKVAMMTFSKSDKLQECSPTSFLWAVFEAGSLGFAIDGKLFHAVPRKGLACCQPDWKGLIAAAKRAKLIRHADAELICENDEFEHGKDGGSNILRHTYDIREPRGSVIGAFARVWLPDGLWDYELMSLPELQKVAKKSTFSSGPWTTDTGEMQKKTVLRRILKGFQDDPCMQALLDMDDREYERVANPDAPLPTGTPVTAKPSDPYAALTESLAPVPGEQSFPQGTESALPIMESAPPQSIDDVGEEPDLTEGPNQDDVNIDQYSHELAGCESAWDVDSLKSQYMGVFKSQEAKDRANKMHSAAKSRIETSRPAPPPAKSKKTQKTAFPTNANTGT